ncbi:MAG: ISAs1 family transposase [Anaerolineae bacterium]|nr:ISAs1 family transposase [Anaerolineae bacterium]
MTQSPSCTIAEHFGGLKDPRTGRMVEHYLLDILTIAICGAICGADDWVAIEAFGQAKAPWLRTFLQLPNGIPSHDTFRRVFNHLEPEAFQACFVKWMQGVAQLSQGEIVPIDGKCLRRSYDRGAGKAAIYMVSAWAASNRLVLGQRKTDEKSNEITAIPELLSRLALQGCIVTIDAMGCQTTIAHQIIEQEADYVLALKGNQGTLHQDVQSLFAYAFEKGFQDIEHDTYQTVDKGHGRLEIRRYWTISDPQFLTWLDPKDKWAGLASIGRVEAQRIIADEVTTDTRYYISSLSGDAVQFGQAVRTHWQIENCLHWVLDISFREDDCRIRTGHGPQNMAVLRHIALNLLRQEQTAKCGVKNKRLKAAWDHDYLLKILSNLS